MLDSSPQVRDAAVELIGKYVASIPEVAGEYYEQIADRIAVRKLIGFFWFVKFQLSQLGYRFSGSQTRYQTVENFLSSFFSTGTTCRCMYQTGSSHERRG